MKAKELHELSSDELKSKRAQFKEELFNLRFQLATNNLDNPARIRQVKRDIARCHTLLRERELQAKAH